MFLLGAKERFPRPASISCSSSSLFGVFSPCFSGRKKFTKKLFPVCVGVYGAKRFLPLASFRKNTGK